jgi:hypothetical protein
LKGRPNFLHFPHRLIKISPQFGQRNFVASVPGGIGLPQLVQVTRVNVAALSAMIIISVVGSVIVGPTYKSFENLSASHYYDFGAC